MPAFDKPDIDEVVITETNGDKRRVLPLEIWFDAQKSTGEWKLKAFDPASELDLDIPMRSITNWRPA